MVLILTGVYPVTQVGSQILFDNQVVLNILYTYFNVLGRNYGKNSF